MRKYFHIILLFSTLNLYAVGDNIPSDSSTLFFKIISPFYKLFEKTQHTYLDDLKDEVCAKDVKFEQDAYNRRFIYIFS